MKNGPALICAAALLTLGAVLPLAAQPGDSPTAGTSAAPPSAQLTPETAAYVLTGEFNTRKMFRPMEFVKIVSALPALRTQDPELGQSIVEAVRPAAGADTEALLAYLATYRTDPCRARHIEANLDVKGFKEFLHRMLAGRDLALACTAMKEKDFKSAISVLDGTLLKDPRFGTAYLHRAIARSALGDKSGASFDYREAQKTPMGSERDALDCVCDPSVSAAAADLKAAMASGEGLKTKGVEAFLKGDFPKALSHFNEAAAWDPGDPEIYMSRAAVHEKLGDPDSAGADLRTAARHSMSSGRWEMALDAVLGGARHERSREELKASAERLEKIVRATPETWPRRVEARTEASNLRKRASSAPSKK